MENLDIEVGGSRKNTDVQIGREPNVNLESDENENFVTGIYFPQVSDELRPIKGKEFQTLDDVQTFYNAYAKEAGFSVRSWSNKKKKGSNEIIRKEYVCFKQGRCSIKENVGQKRRRGSSLESCKAKLAVVKSKSGSFIVSIFAEAHSHPLSSPKKTHLLRSHRKVSAATKSLTQQLSMVNIPSHQQYSFLEVQSGGIENVGCTQRDLYNHEIDECTDTKGHDRDMFFEYLKLEQEKNPSFAFKIEVDDEQKITRCFWSDATSRRAYKFYGDVIIFDIIYNTNRYGLIFAPIMGINNHGQTIVFGCGFLNNETVDSFVWLFNQFLESMSGDAPKMIITDQDPVMTSAFSIVLQNTYHRYCSWHIFSNFSEKIDAIKYDTYQEKFSACIWKSESPEEFDIEWKNLIKESGLEGNKWLNDIYAVRSRWIPAYVNHMFSAGMSNSQQAESVHAFFKKCVSKNNSLVDFMILFGRELVRQCHEELISDHKDIIEKPKLIINYDFLVQIADIYTHQMLHKFQDELCESFNFRFRFIRESDDHRVYQVERRNVEASKIFEIIYDKHLDFASCGCKKFDSEGILCRHILAYLNKFHDNLCQLPDKYILKRWTKSAKSGTVIDDSGVHFVDVKSLFVDRCKLIQFTLDVIDKALVCEETRNMYKDGLRSINEQIDQFISSRESAKDSKENSNPTGGCATSAHGSCTFENSYKELSQVQPKGCEKRLDEGKEKVLARAKNRKIRRCHGCGKVGQAHDKRNCPALMNCSSPRNENENLSEDNGLPTQDEDEISVK